MTKIGTKIIKSYQEKMPDRSGVYQMIGEKGDVLYIGKAKNLKKRVLAYTSIENHSFRIQKMILQTKSVKIIITDTEKDALILEAELVKKIKPKYNILLRDDKTFPYIAISKGAYPRVFKYRGEKMDNCVYFGPFVLAQEIDDLLSDIHKKFLLRSCSDSVFIRRIRPCLEYQINRCSAPCVGYISEKEYKKSVAKAKKILNRGLLRDKEFVFSSSD